MSKTAIEVITSVQRRRRWTAEEKERLVAASLADLTLDIPTT
jgi:transposase-like protein